jgi:glycosyltransferase involved in cell wall biosynthesis
MSNSPKVSVVMSVFNGEAFLSEAIESILNQTFRDFEFIIIDDGSTDKTAEILAAYASRDLRIRIRSHENKGLAVSLNVGIGLAQGKYVARMDADDISLPTRFQQQVDFLEAHPEVGVLGGASEVINLQRQVIDIRHPPLQDSEIKAIMFRHNIMSHPSVMMRREILLAVGGYRPALVDAEDYDLFLRMGERSQLANLDTPLIRLRIHPNQVSRSHLQHQVVCALAAQVSASLRKRGQSDPLCRVAEVSLPLLESLGVGREQFRQKLLAHRNFWINLLKRSDPDAALNLIEDVLQSDEFGPPDRSSRVNASLVAAGIYYRKGIRVKAVRAAARAFLLKPSLAALFVRRGLSRVGGRHLP